MSDGCAPFRPLLDGFADGEVERARVEPHLSSCGACRAELEAVLALKARLARVRLPDVPRSSAAWRRDAEATPGRAWRRRAAAAAAAGAFLAVLAFMGASPPPLLAHSARLHDDVLSGRVTLSDLGIAPNATKADYEGRCPCPPDLGEASPFVVYRNGGALVSLLAIEEREPERDGGDVVRRVGPDTVISEARNGLRLVWISRLDERALRRAADALRPAPGTSLRAFTCGACCSLLESRGREGGPVSMELLTSPEGGRVDPARVTGFRPLPLK